MLWYDEGSGKSDSKDKEPQRIVGLPIFSKQSGNVVIYYIDGSQKLKEKSLTVTLPHKCPNNLLDQTMFNTFVYIADGQSVFIR